MPNLIILILPSIQTSFKRITMNNPHIIKCRSHRIFFVPNNTTGAILKIKSRLDFFHYWRVFFFQNIRILKSVNDWFIFYWIVSNWKYFPNDGGKSWVTNFKMKVRSSEQEILEKLPDYFLHLLQNHFDLRLQPLAYTLNIFLILRFSFFYKSAISHFGCK